MVLQALVVLAALALHLPSLGLLYFTLAGEAAVDTLQAV